MVRDRVSLAQVGVLELSLKLQTSLLFLALNALLKGVYEGDWFEVEQWPEGDYRKEEWQEHRTSMEREWERRRRSKELGLLPSHKQTEES